MIRDFLKSPFSVILCISSLLLTALISQSIYRSYLGPDYARQRLVERKNYHEKVLKKADVSFEEAYFFEVVK